MGRYRVQLASSASRELQKLPAKVVRRVFPELEALASNPRPQGCKKLQGGANEWRIRVGDYRIVYAIDDAEKIIDVARIAHRREVYKS